MVIIIIVVITAGLLIKVNIQSNIINEQKREIEHLQEKIMDKIWQEDFMKGGNNIG